MLATWTNLQPAEQAAALGLVVTVLFYLARFVRPGWFTDCEQVARWKRMAVSVLACGAAVAVSQLTTGGWHGWLGFALSWAAAYGTAEGAHTVAARTSGAVGQKAEQAVNAVLMSIQDWA
jgi:hypothetical protein